MTTTPAPVRVTAARIVEIYRAADAEQRAELRRIYRKMAMEFDAIDRAEDRARRMEELKK